MIQSFKKATDYCKKNNISTILVDLWGTIIQKNCLDEEVKKAWAKQLSFVLHFRFDPSFLYECRKMSERAVSNWMKEVSFYEVAKVIYDRLSIIDDELSSLSKSGFIAENLSIELAVLKQYSYLSEAAVGFLKDMKAEKKRIIICTDYYLGKTEVLDLLRHFNIANIQDDIIVSSEIQKKKADGSLYQFLLNDLHIIPEMAVMIGDDKTADIKNAQKNGIKAFRVIKHSSCKKNSVENYLKSVFQESFNGINRYGNYAFSLYLFIDRLYKYIYQRGFEQVVFLSREGELLKELFDILQDKRTKIIDSYYMYVSRKAVYPASLQKLEKESFNPLRREGSMSANDFFSSIGFESEKSEYLGSELSIDMDMVVENFFDSSVFQKIRENNTFAFEYERNRKKQIGLLSTYLSQFHIQERKTVLVDVGWNGSMQDNICKICDNTIAGCYIGILASANTSIHNHKKGLLFSENPVASTDIALWKYDHTFYERILCASHGSTDHYEAVGDKVIPALVEYAEDNLNYSLVRPIQEIILQKFNIIEDIMSRSPFDIEEFYDLVKELHRRTLFEANIDQLRLQGKMLNNQIQNFGRISTNKERMDATFSRKRIITKLFSRIGVVKNTELISKILLSKGFYRAVFVLYRLKYLFND